MTAAVQTSAHRFCVAPMMDWTDRHCRFFHRQLTARALLYTEMVTAQAVRHGDRARLLGFDPREAPVALQLGGSDPGLLADAARWGQDFGYAEVNLNVGCPSDRVQEGRFGACLMAEPGLVADCVAAMRGAVSIPVTVKCRIGIDDQDSEVALEHFISTVASAGCQTFIVHARKAWLRGLSPKENREIPPLDYDRVYRLKSVHHYLNIILNGGISSHEFREKTPRNCGWRYARPNCLPAALEPCFRRSRGVRPPGAGRHPRRGGRPHAAVYRCGIGARHLALPDHPPHARALSWRTRRSSVAPHSLRRFASNWGRTWSHRQGARLRGAPCAGVRRRMRPRYLLCTLIFMLCLFIASPRAQTVDCVGDDWAGERICADPDLRERDQHLAARLLQVIEATRKKTLRSLIQAAQEDWAATLDTCRSAADPKPCLTRRIARRVDALTLLWRLMAGPSLPPDPARTCASGERAKRTEACLNSFLAAADVGYSLIAEAFELSLATVNIQGTGPDGGAEANKAAEAFRDYRTAACAVRALSPMVEAKEGSIIACEAALTLRESADLIRLMGRNHHWSENLGEYAPAIRACFDRLRDQDVAPRVIDILPREEGERSIRILGSRGGYDCVAIGQTVSGIEPVPVEDGRAGAGDAIFVPVAGTRAPDELLATPLGGEAACYDVAAAIVAPTRLSGWIATSRCAEGF